MTTLIIFMFVFLVIIIVGIVNEKFFHIPNDIALVLLSTIIGISLLLLSKIESFSILNKVTETYSSFDFAEFLFHGVHCFMLFAGASKLHFSKLMSNAKSVLLLSTVTTVIFAAGFGFLFWLAAKLLGIAIDIWVCILLGCILGPTAPLAVTGILDKLGVAKSVTYVMEGESLFNEGISVALFVFVKGIVESSHSENFVIAISKEILGAVIVSLIISFITFFLVRHTRDPLKQIIISLLNVSCSYIICESFGLSGAVASVVCGIYYAYSMEKIRRSRVITDPHELYDGFWHIIDDIINNVLFVLIGFSVLTITFSVRSVWLCVFAVIIALISRAVGVLVSSFIIGKKNLPLNYTSFEYTSLMTWSGLRGGLSLALAMNVKALFADTPVIYTHLIDTTYIVILFTVIVQGFTSGFVFKLIEKHKTKRLHKKR